MASESRPGDRHAAVVHRPEPGGRTVDPRAFDRVLYVLLGICALLFAIDPLIEKHPYFDIEHWWAFYGVYGLVMCVALVLVARVLRVIVRRPEDYYDR